MIMVMGWVGHDGASLAANAQGAAAKAKEAAAVRNKARRANNVMQVNL
jgi:hypothetical protein